MSDITTWQDISHRLFSEQRIIEAHKAEISKLRARVAELEAQVEHWKQARQNALDAGDIMKAKLAALEGQEPHIYLSPKGRLYATKGFAVSNGEQMVTPLYLAAGAREAQPMTQEQFELLAHRRASKYTHRSAPDYSAYTFLPHTLADFVRDIEAHHNILGETK